MSANEKKVARGVARWAVKVLVVVIAGVLLAYVLFVLSGKAVLARKIAELRRRGCPTSYEELQARTTIPEGVANAADLYIQAFAAYTEPATGDDRLLPLVGSVRQLELPRPGEPLPGRMKMPLRRFIAANRQTLDLLRQAARVEHCRFPQNAQYPSAPLMDFQRVDRCADLLVLAVMNDANEVASEDVFGAVSSSLRLGEALLGDPTFSSYFTGLYVFTKAAKAVEYAVNDAGLSERQMVDLQKELGRIRRNYAVDRLVTRERVVVLENVRDPGWRRLVDDLGPAGYPGLFEWNVWLYLVYIDRAEQGLSGPHMTEPAKVMTALAGAEGLPSVCAATKAMIENTQATASFANGAFALLDAARTALAIERYRQAHNRLPQRLADLVPQYLDAVPIDPSCGEPLQYTPHREAYMVHTLIRKGL